MSTKVLLIYPVPSIASPQRSPPLSILYVGEALKQAVKRGMSDEEFEVRYFDERYDDMPDIDWPDIVGVSSMTGYQLKGAILWLQYAKLHNKRTILGGIHATMQPEQCLEEPYVDSVVLSEGEWAVLDAIGGSRIAQRHLNGEHVSPVSPDTLIHFQRSAKTGDTILLTSRGCPFRCQFAVSEDTLISTPNGTMRADDLNVGDLIFGLNEQASIIEKTRVESMVYPETDSEIVIETQDGNTLVCSPEHPIMTRRGWVLAGELLETDEVLIEESPLLVRP